MVALLCAFVQGQSSNASVKEKGPHGAGHKYGSLIVYGNAMAG